MQKIAPNATVVGPREAVESATRWGSARARVAATLERRADDVDARIPDGRASSRHFAASRVSTVSRKIWSVTAPTCLRWMRPSRSMKNVSGTPYTP